jgi:sugar/nucleoside kinase (ribokinase family)
MSLVVGGSAAITAVAAARLGLRVALVAAVGADPAGEFMLDQLRA